MLHSFYNGAENALKRILIETDVAIPSGPASHAELLKQAATDGQGRPPVISAELHQSLLPFMAFRHFFRHAYSFQMNWERMQDLVTALPRTAEMLRDELTVFLRRLESEGELP